MIKHLQQGPSWCVQYWDGQAQERFLLRRQALHTHVPALPVHDSGHAKPPPLLDCSQISLSDVAFSEYKRQFNAY